MPSILSKNCITSGIIDFYCLVCCSNFEYETDAYSHINVVKHKEALKLIQYVEKYKADLIRKIRVLYFCESCDMIFPTATKVRLHINDPDHITQIRNAKPIERRNNNILAFENVLISDCAWNGFIDDTCILCNTEFIEKLKHVAEETHRLNLIKGKIVSEAKDIIYRKIDNNLVQCLTCNELISESAIVHHIDSAEHKNMYKLISNAENEDNDTKLYNTGAIKKTNVNKGTIRKHNANKQSSKSTDKSDLINLVNRYQEEKINVNLIAETAICKICSKNVDFSVEGVERHIEQHKDLEKSVEKDPVPKLSTSKSSGVNVKINGDLSSDGIDQNKTRPQSPSDNADDFARKNALMRVPGDRLQRFYCKPCDLFVSPTLWNLKDHVYNTDHSENISKQNDPKILHGNLKKIPLITFVASIEMMDVDGFPFTLIDNKYMVPAINFLLISNFRNQLSMCQICDIDFRIGELEELEKHFLSEAHMIVVNHSLVVASMPHEFIRTVRNDKYHCGYCDKLESDWDDMLEHITIEAHYLNKLRCREVLDQFREKRESRLQENNLSEFMKNFDAKRFNF